MITVTDIFLLSIAYLLGSIPTAVWIGKFFYNTDVREYGSGNAGATNAFRVLGKKAGIPVLLIDSLKGFAAVKLACLSNYSVDGNQFINLELVLGIASLIGHIFPVFASFRGGKGIATLLGVILAVHLFAALSAIGVFLIVLLITRYVSLSSITAAVLFPVIMTVLFKVQIPALVIFSILISILVLLTHQKNIERLLRKEESKANILKKKKEKTKIVAEEPASRM